MCIDFPTSCDQNISISFIVAWLFFCGPLFALQCFIRLISEQRRKIFDQIGSCEKKNGSQTQIKGKICKAFDMLIFKVIISQGRGIALFDIFIEYLISLPSPGAHSIWTSSEVGTVYEHTVVLMMKRMRMRMDENGVHYRRPRRRSRDVKRRQGVGLKVVGEAIWDSH